MPCLTPLHITVTKKWLTLYIPQNIHTLLEITATNIHKSINNLMAELNVLFVTIRLTIRNMAFGTLKHGLLKAQR